MDSGEILQVGRPAPFVRALNQSGRAMSFTDLLGDKQHVVLCFCRGHWCPACVARLGEINVCVEDLGSLEASVYAVSTDSMEQSAAMQREMGLKFDVLSDPDCNMVKAWGLFNPYESGGVAKPALAVLDKEGVVRYLAFDGVVCHVPFTKVKEFLEQRLAEGGHQGMDSPSSLARIKASTVMQTGRNVLQRGSRANWKHYALAPLEVGMLLHDSVYGAQRVFLSREYPVPPEEVFPHFSTPELMNRFLDAVLTRIKASPTDKENPNGVGSVRKVKIGPSTLEETITRLEPPYLCQYVISKGSPLKDYTGTILISRTKTGSRVVWTMTFKAKAPYTGRLIAKAMEAGFSKGLKTLSGQLN
ncbi:Peroxiredoxin [Desulfatibacillum alkenivorans DSM 16219]|jgi:peroxiredoxin/uncharacterized protein YndB with AHSA1/START domain|uniref:thioredoxin-dependent peroxiredoxin n=1 Tax=Desulfatibacillum alkenivorans DSM 16219 TaxID=1121393 RepID=A0A1M6N1E1_9BACT|nr:redoxin domain-containing protein [Desulfatibacillum alkenivorans]SHJ89436.1 Peroxiredoxin [Desulfatibacillum alkenivorans DSM 16219]